MDQRENCYQNGWLIIPITKFWDSAVSSVMKSDTLTQGTVIDLVEAGMILKVAIPVSDGARDKPLTKPSDCILLHQLDDALDQLSVVFTRYGQRVLDFEQARQNTGEKEENGF